MEQKELKQPFFVQFLNAQDASSQEKQNNTGTHPVRDNLHTLKYPSDQDEGSPDF